jgi:hypothetical protein
VQPLALSHHARALLVIIRNLRQQTQLQTLWKSGENLNDLHATEMVQTKQLAIGR